MFAHAELTLTIDAIADSGDLAAFIARAVDLGFVVTGAGPDPDPNLSGRFAVSVTSGPDKEAAAVQRAFDKLLAAANAME